MKFLHYICFLVLISGFLSCSKKDNYDAPGSPLTGALLYNGDSIHLEYDRVPYQLYQFGFGKVGAIDGTFDQSVFLHALLFNGTYKLIIPNGQGPFLWKKTAAGDPDTLAITVNGSSNINLDVTPFYMIRNAQISGAGSKVNATFKLEKIITGVDAKDIENATLYINKTQFVSGSNNVANAGIDGVAISDINNISLSVDIPALVPTQNYVFARVGVKIAGCRRPYFFASYQSNLLKKLVWN
jgi:hypothetical protein